MIRIFRGTFLLAMSLLSFAVESVHRLADKESIVGTFSPAKRRWR
jgi:hypothetical protein